MSHLSDLSQVYNQNLRLKFGSAPAQLLSKGEQAEKSLEKRVNLLKNQFDLSNLVNTKSQLSQHLSKQAMQGTVSTISWAKWEDGKKSYDPSLTQGTENSIKSNMHSKNRSKLSNPIKYSEVSEDSSDDDFRPLKSNIIKNSISKKDQKVSSAMTGDSARSISSSSHSMGKYF